MHNYTTSKLNTESEQFNHTFKRSKPTTKFVMNYFFLSDLSDFIAQCTKERFQIPHVVIPCEKSEKKMTEFILDFLLEKSKVLVILGIQIIFLTFFC